MGYEDRSTLVSIGLVRKPIGLAGWVGVTAYGGSIEQLSLPCDVLMQKALSKHAENAQIVAVEHHPKGYRIKFAGVNSFEQAEPLRNSEIFLYESQLPAVSDEEYYHFELEGLDVIVDSTRELIGKVVSVLNYPSVDALEIRRNDGKNVIVPFTPEAVKEVNKDKDYVVINGSTLQEIL